MWEFAQRYSRKMKNKQKKQLRAALQKIPNDVPDDAKYASFISTPIGQYKVFKIALIKHDTYLFVNIDCDWSTYGQCSPVLFRALHHLFF